MSQKIIWFLLDFTSHLLSFGSSLSVLVLSPYLSHLRTTFFYCWEMWASSLSWIVPFLLRAIDFVKVPCEVVTVRRGAMENTWLSGPALFPLSIWAGLNLILECPGWQAPYMGFTAPLLQRVKPLKHSLSQKSPLGTVLKKNGCCCDEWAVFLLLCVRAWVKEGACHR